MSKDSTIKSSAVDDDGDENSPVMAAASILASAAASIKGPDKEVAASNNGCGDGAAEQANGASEAPGDTVTHECRWQVMFERLKIYKEKHGNCLVPNRHAKDTQLGSWVSAQRRQYKIVTSSGNESAAMTPERAMKLREIGFEWSTTNPRNVPWETRYDELRDFVVNYGHAEVPMRWEENPQLSNWVSKQRHQHKLMQMGRPSRLTRARVQLLSDIGFVWEASRRRLDGSDTDSDEESETDTPKSKKKKKRPKLASKLGPNATGASRNALPVFSEARRGRMGMDPPAAMGVSMLQQGGAAQDPFAAAQVFMAAGPTGILQANLGLWAAAASGRAGFMPPQIPPAVAAAAARQGLNPAMFYPMGSMMPMGAIMPGGMPPAMLRVGLGNRQQQMHADKTDDPPADSDTGAGDRETAGDSEGEGGNQGGASQTRHK